VHAGRAGQRNVAHHVVSARYGTNRGMRRGGGQPAARPTSRPAARRAAGPAAARRRAAYRLTVAAVLVGAGVVHGGPAPAASNVAINPYIYPDPFGSAQLPATFNVYPGGFDPAAAYTLLIDGVQHPFTISGGVFSFTASPSCGLHDANISRAGSGSEDLNFYISCIAATPASVAYSSEPRVIAVSGTDWLGEQGDEVIIELDGKQVATAVPDSDSGTFLTRFIASGLGCTPHTITAVEQVYFDESPRDIIASTPLAVTGCPAITANPAVFTEGTLTHVTGTGFAPNQPITLAWRSAAGAVLSACSPNAASTPSPQADAAGRLDTYCYARPHEALGAAQIQAVQGTQHAAAPVVVEGGSMQPSSGDQFVFRR
jgi:hypothetical protein